MHVLDGDAGHALGGIDGRADAVLGAVEMGDHAGLEAFGAGVVEAQHLELHRSPLPSNQSGAGEVLAIRQQILLVPMSSAATTRWRLLLIVVV